MRIKIAILSSLLFFLFFFLITSSSSVQVTLNLNATKVEWKEVVNASGYVTSDGNPWLGNVSIRLAEEEVCFVSTNANGFFTCNFNAPSSLRNFPVVAYAINNSQVVGKSKEILLSVVYFYGKEAEAKSIASIDFPALIQDLDGSIHKVKVYVKVWE